MGGASGYLGLYGLCGLFTLFVIGIAAVLYVVGRAQERRARERHVESKD